MNPRRQRAMLIQKSGEQKPLLIMTGIGGTKNPIAANNQSLGCIVCCLFASGVRIGCRCLADYILAQSSKMIGDIVENDPVPPREPSFTMAGFPKSQKRNPSKWRSRLGEKGISSTSDSLKPKMSESEKIHQDNAKLIDSMSPDQIERERQELIDSLDPKVLQLLIDKSKEQDHAVLEGYGTWVGGSSRAETDNRSSDDIKEYERNGEAVNEKNEKSDKKVRFAEEARVQYDEPPSDWEDVQDLETAKTEVDNIEGSESTSHQDKSSEKFANSIHFPAAPSIDINDPNFNEKLHEKFFPDFPANLKKLEWTQPLPKPTKDLIYESPQDLRFDFKGNLISSDIDLESFPTQLGLHHHASDPELPGYSLPELAHLSRSTFAPQRCIAIQTLGRILFKVGSGLYTIVAIDEDNNQRTDSEKEIMDNFNAQVHNLIQELKIVESIIEASDEKQTSNLSVRNYAIEALWLWRQGKR